GGLHHPQAYRAQRDPAGGDARRSAGGPDRRRRRADRDDLRLAGHRAAPFRQPDAAGIPGAPWRLLRLLGAGRALQHHHGPRLSRRGPPDRDRQMNPSKRFSRNKGGVIGLIVLIVIFALAILADFLYPQSPWKMVGRPMVAPGYFEGKFFFGT